jgi:hypothetical protein
MKFTLSHLSLPRSFASTAVFFSVALIGCALLGTLVVLEEARLAVASMVLITLMALAIYDLRLAIYGCLVYLILLGDLRRLLLYADTWSGADPLLIVGPGFVIMLFFYLLSTGRIDFDTPISICVIAMMVIMTLQIFNPKQGGLIVGVGGILFLMVPIFWFWIGRAFGTPEFINGLLYSVVCPLGVLSILFGIYQVLYGYLPYQLTWYHAAGYLGLGNLETGLAPISFFASGSEHGTFGIMTGVLILTLGLTKDRRFFFLFPVVIIATLLTGSRGPVAKLLLVASGLWAIQGTSIKSWIPRGVLVLVMAVVTLFMSLSYVTSSGVGHSVVEHKVNRQAQEFVHGQGAGGGKTTSANHLGMMLHSYTLTFSEPLGRGLGATSRAAKLDENSDYGHSTETDLGDSFLALGFSGGITYHILVFLIIAAALQLWVRTRAPYAMAILGILGVTFLSWLGGGQYAVSPIVWLCIGALDRAQRFQNDAE